MLRRRLLVRGRDHDAVDRVAVDVERRLKRVAEERLAEAGVGRVALAVRRRAACPGRNAKTAGLLGAGGIRSATNAASRSDARRPAPPPVMRT